MRIRTFWNRPISNNFRDPWFAVFHEGGLCAIELLAWTAAWAMFLQTVSEHPSSDHSLVYLLVAPVALFFVCLFPGLFAYFAGGLLAMLLKLVLYSFHRWTGRTGTIILSISFASLLSWFFLDNIVSHKEFTDLPRILLLILPYLLSLTMAGRMGAKIHAHWQIQQGIVPETFTLLRGLRRFH